MHKALGLLEKYWHYTAFRTPQEEIIAQVLSGRDTLALLPTGGGKSICFQIPALMSDGICIVISPLVALIKDQVARLTTQGIKAVALSGSLNVETTGRILDNCTYGKYKFLYLSPERLQQEIVQQRIKKMNVNLIAVDEAHCISQWGNDFRPAYRNCSLLRSFFPNVPTIALTASATQNVIADIIENLQLQHVAVIKKSFERKNIAYMVFETADKWYKTVQILKKKKGSAIVYVRSRKAAKDISDNLNKIGIAANFYHGGITPEEKTIRLQQWLSNTVKTMVATNAFGMGIDKPDVNVVIHMHLPENLENYYQEAGRAGRDGKTAYAIILKNSSDEIRLRKQFLEVYPNVDFVKLLYKKLNSYFKIPYGEGAYSTFVFRMDDFCTTYHFNAAQVYNGLKLLDRNGILHFSEAHNRKTMLQFTVGQHGLFQYLDAHPELKTITQSILRTYGGLFDHKTTINLHYIARKTATTKIVVEKVLEQLYKDHIITYNAQHAYAELCFLKPREDDKTINVIAKDVKQQYALKKQQIETVISYMNNDATCRSIQLLSYFGETKVKACGLCSVCISKKRTFSKAAKTQIEAAILTTIHHTPMSSRSLAQELSYEEEDILSILQHLLENRKIAITRINTYKIINS